MKKLLTISIIMSFVLVFACENPFQLTEQPFDEQVGDESLEQPNNEQSGSGSGEQENGAEDNTTAQPKTVTVGFSVSLPEESEPREIAPREIAPKGLSVTFVTVTAERTGYSSKSEQLIYDASTNTASGEIEGLAEGEWLFIAEATDSDGNLLYSGQAAHTITDGTNSIPIDVYEEVGALKLQAGWGLAGGFGDLRVTASRATFPSVQVVTSVPRSVTSAETYVVNLTAGDWTIAIEGLDGSTVYFEAGQDVTIETNVVLEQTIGMDQIKATAVSMEPAGGTYNTTQEVYLSTITDGATIKYTTGGSDPEWGTTYTPGTPISVSTDTTLKAIAIKSGLENSAVTTEDYAIQVAAPTFTPVPGTYTESQQVALASTTDGASIRYTTDGTTQPTEWSGTYYSTGSPITVNDDTTIVAIAYKSGCTPSAVVSGEYVITGTVEAPTFDPPGGTYAGEQQVSLTSATDGASIRYTVDGVTDPTPTTGTLYDGNPITVGTDVQLRAVAYKQDWAPSTVSTAVYTLDITYTTLESTDPIGGVLTGFTQMTLANSPYHIGANTLIESGSILKIEPGVTVIFDGYYYIQADGILLAEGTDTDGIIFTSSAQSSSNDWKQITINSASSVVQYCDFSYAGYGLYLATSLNNTQFAVDSCRFTTCQYGLFLYDLSALVHISNCSFQSCYYGIYADSVDQSAVVDSCTFVQCSNAGLLAYSAIFNLSNSLFDLCYRGIYTEYSGFSLSESTFRNSSKEGIYAYWVDDGTSVDLCNFYDNTDAGISFYGDTETLVVRNSNISDGVRCMASGDYDIDLSNNYWGTTDTSVIDGMIYDYYDNFERPTIIYEPILTDMVPDAGYSGDTYTPAPSNTDILASYQTDFSNLATKISALDPVADDENPDDYITQYTIPGDIGGNCVVTTTIDSVTIETTIVYDFNGYNDTGTVYTSPGGQELTSYMDSSSNGSFTGRIDITGDVTGYIIYNLTFTGGVTTGYYDVNGEQIDF